MADWLGPLDSYTGTWVRTGESGDLLGPPGLPILGNVRGIDVAAPWRTYARWGKQYGDLVYSRPRLFQQDIIIINSEKVAKELLDERSNNYANRPHFVISALFGADFNTAFMPYGPRWQSVPRFHPLQQQKSRQLLRGLLESPELYYNHLHEYSTSVIMQAVYDYNATPLKDKFVDMANWGTKLVVEAMRPEVSMLFSTFPFLLYLPFWFPGMGIKRKGALARPSAKACLEQTFLFAVERKESGSTGPAMVLDALLKKDAANASEEDMQALKEAAGTAFGDCLPKSPTSTTKSASALMTFFLSMLLFPEVQEKAQAQIDAVVGLDRVPTIEDRPSLTYIDAILRETLRWSPVLPLSIPTTTIESDVYQGYYIPKGAIIMTNLWAMAHDEEKYPKPFDFIPERFLDEDGNLTQDDVVNIGYGFGRRICVGRHFADPSLWTAMVSILATFKISRAKDHDGRDVYFKPEWSTGLTTQPLPFPCNVTPRVVGLDAEKLEKMMGTGA
ncbi:cytochrome P450 [Melanogaster broomeanus]|nr:cytochrome P450 [Melanogaster broomeanus]